MHLPENIATIIYYSLFIFDPETFRLQRFIVRVTNDNSAKKYVKSNMPGFAVLFIWVLTVDTPRLERRGKDSDVRLDLTLCDVFALFTLLNLSKTCIK